MRTSTHFRFNKNAGARLLAAAFGALLLAAPLRADELGGPDPGEEQKYIQEYLDEAFNAYVTEDYEKALLNFQKVLQIDPKEPAALKGAKLCRKKLEKGAEDRVKQEESKIKLAKKLVKEEKWLDAIDNLREIVTRSPQQSDAIELLGGIEADLRKRISDAVVGSGDYLFYQGILFYLNKRYQDAVQVWKEAEAVAYDNMKVSVYIERVMDLAKENTQYERTQERARAKAAFDAGSFEEAAALWRKMLERDPQDAQAQAGLAQAQEMADKKNKQNVIGEYYDKGLTYFQQEKFAESLREWKKILAIDPKNEVALDYVRKIQRKGIAVGDLPAPVQSSTPTAGSNAPAVPRQDPPDLPVPPAPATPAADHRKGMDYLKDGRYQKAIDYFDAALRNRPDDAEAKEWLDKAIKEQNEEAENHYKQGIVAYSVGSVDEAIREWQLALEIYPNHIPSKRALAKIEAGGTRP